jgi:predicted HTH transcriptional regulator
MWPQKLDGWSLSAIEELLIKGCFESDGFDFKERLPHSKNQDEARRLLKTCCAFANSSGGFLIFGVRDDRGALAEDRLVGLDPAEDFPEHFGKFPQKCIPGVYWNFRNPPLTLPNGRIIHVIEIPGSWKKPHCFKMGDESLCFAKMTNQGNDVMSYSEISMNFLGFYEKRLKLQLLQAELENILEDAEEMKAPLGGTWYTINEFEMSVIESVLVDVYTILATYPELIKLLARIRSIC